MINDFNKCGKLRDGSALKDCKMFPVGRTFTALSIFPASSFWFCAVFFFFFLSMAHYQFSQHHLSDSLQQPFSFFSLFVGSAIFVRGVYNQFLGPSLPFGYRLWGVQILQSSLKCDQFYMQNTDFWRCTNKDETHWVQTASIWNLNTSSGGNF